MVEDEFVELADAIAVLRAQLNAAREARDDTGPRFVVDKVEVELALEARREAGGEGGVQFGVFTLKGRGGGSRGATHRVRLELTPKGANGASFEIHGEVSEPPVR